MGLAVPSCAGWRWGQHAGMPTAFFPIGDIPRPVASRSMARHGLWLSVVLSLAGCVDCGQVPGGDGDPQCVGVDTCGQNEVCAGGACVASPECLAIDDWPFCREALNELETGLGATAICQSDGEGTLSFHCSVACQVDDDCAAGRLCTDFGRCVDGLLRETPGPALGAHATLLAGVGEVRLDVPLTTSLGGLSSRAGPGDGSWADGMDAAVGTLDGLWARAASLDAGDGRFLVIRLPIIFPTGAMTEAIAARITR